MSSNINPPTPRWVKISGIVAIILILGFLLLHLSGHSFHHQ
ncbi:MAG TPA: hypothetical protein VNS58_15765 [Puia sp.]|nr:hypothetical protein [Puia sp.]